MQTLEEASEFSSRSAHINIILLAIAAASLLCFAAWYTAAWQTAPPEPSPYPKWTLLVDGLIQRPLNLTLDEIAAMPRTTVDSEIYCLPAPGSSGVLVEEGNWTGVRLGLVLQRAGVSPEAVKIALYAEDGFTTDLNLTAATRGDVILAYEKDGELLPQTLRLVAPGRYGYKWIKWVTRVELVGYDFRGTYESLGFPDDAVIPEKWHPSTRRFSS